MPDEMLAGAPGHIPEVYLAMAIDVARRVARGRGEELGKGEGASGQCSQEPGQDHTHHHPSLMAGYAGLTQAGYAPGHCG